MLARGALACLVLALALVARAPAQDLQSQLDAKEAAARLRRARQEGVLSTDDRAATPSEIDQLAARSRRCATARRSSRRELDRDRRPSLDREREHLNVLRERLDRSIECSRAPGRDLQVRRARRAHGDPPGRRLRRPARALRVPEPIQEQDAAIVDRVRTLRDETRRPGRAASARRATRSPPASAELERTRIAARGPRGRARRRPRRKARTRSPRSRRTSSASRATSATSRADIQAQLQAAQAAAPATPTLPAGPVQGESSSGFIWPVNGPVVSPFGLRWGRMHEGIDIAGPGGHADPRRRRRHRRRSPRRTSGYGNYTCIDHGGGLSTCYAHQSSLRGHRRRSRQAGRR